MSIVTLNVNGLNLQLKGRVCQNKLKTYASTIFSQQDILTIKTDISCNSKHKEAEATILVSDKVDYKTVSITRDKEGYLIMVIGPIHQEDVTVLSMHLVPKSFQQSVRPDAATACSASFTPQPLSPTPFLSPTQVVLSTLRALASL